MLQPLQREHFQVMNTVSKVTDWLALRQQFAGKTIGFIPTMGHLHEGHLSLCRQSLQENELTVVTIFVNPTQFNQTSDFDLYPRTLENDQAMLNEVGVNYLLIPDASEIYHDQYQVQISETEISKELEGEFRPGHFNGMLTVVMKLLNLVQPTRAYFGEKDFQQLALIKKMVSALFIPMEIIGCETRRADDGLALSSRNSRLNETQREKAVVFARLLKSANPPAIIADLLTDAGFKVDYIAEKWGRRLGAVWLDDVRLIDNIPVNEVI